MKPKEQTEEQKALEQAQALIQAKQNEKAQKYLKDYKLLSESAGYRMSAKITITEQGVVPELVVVKM